MGHGVKKKMLTHEPSVTHEHETVEAICPRCHLPGDAICPHCKADLHPQCLVEDFNSPAGMNNLIVFSEFVRVATRKRNSKFWLVCYLIAAGSAEAGGVSMVDVAKEFRVTKACVSKTCVAISKMLPMPSRYMRREAAREVYRKTNRRNGK